MRLFDGKTAVNHKNSLSSSVWYDDGSAEDTTSTAKATTTATVTVTAAHQDQSPVRPPRRRCKPLVTSGSVSSMGTAKRSHSLTTSTTPIMAEIKSILKKPTSLTTDDLSPVRVRSPDVANTAPSITVPSSGSQKKTKKQVQFDIVTVPSMEKVRAEIPVEALTQPQNRSPAAEIEPSASAQAPTVPHHQQCHGRQSPTRKSPYSLIWF